MSEMVKSSIGFFAIWCNKLLPEVSKITEPKETTAKTDNSSQANAHGIKTRDAGWIDVGDITISLKDIGDTTYADLKAAQRARTKGILELPYAPLGSGRSIQGQAFISEVTHGHADDGGAQTIEVVFTPTSYFSELSTPATGLSGLSVVDEDAHAISISPAFGAAVYEYDATAYIGSASVLITPTGSGTIYVNGSDVTSGEASAAIPIGQTQGDVTMIAVVCSESNKSSKIYLLRVKMGNAAYA